MITLLKKSMSSVTYSSLCLPDNIAERGLESVPNFYYRDDGLKLWNIINRWEWACGWAEMGPFFKKWSQVVDYSSTHLSFFKLIRYEDLVFSPWLVAKTRFRWEMFGHIRSIFLLRKQICSFPKMKINLKTSTDLRIPADALGGLINLHRSSAREAARMMKDSVL